MHTNKTSFFEAEGNSVLNDIIQIFDVIAQVVIMIFVFYFMFTSLCDSGHANKVSKNSCCYFEELIIYSMCQLFMYFLTIKLITSYAWYVS